MARLVEPVVLAGRTVPAPVVFGPHETNLARGRSIGDRHVAYYRERAAGGTGMIVTETASVHLTDWPYERAPLASSCGDGWAAVAEMCRSFGTVVLAGLGHSGGQGSSAHSQSVLWAPSPVADVVNREMPVEMEQPEIDELVSGFADAARLAVVSGLDGVEIDAGSFSLLRQFHSGLTNHRTDAYGDDRLLLTVEVIDAVRRVIGNERVLSLRLCCDELAPWAGVTPELAAAQVDRVADLVDLVVVVRGGPYSTSACRPDAHTPAAFNVDLCGRMRASAAGRCAVVLQGSVVDPGAALRAIDDGVCDLVEMTRAQIAEPRLVALLREGEGARIRPCILCNQACRVRDDRNPVVGCVGEPRSGHETTDPPTEGTDDRPRDVVVVGAGVSGLECARVLALRGHRVRVVERAPAPGGMAALAAVGRGRSRMADLPAWLAAECRRHGVLFEFDREATAADLEAARADGAEVVIATGSVPGPRPFATDGSVPVVDAPDALDGRRGGAGALPEGPVVVYDPVGGPIAVGVAEWLADSGRQVALVTPDQVAGTLLSRTGDLADANTRLQRAGVHRELRSLLRLVDDGCVVLEDVWTGERRRLEAAVVVHCGHRLPDESLYLTSPGTLRVGDCVAPRGLAEAILEGRRTAMEISAGVSGGLFQLTGGGAP